MRKTLDILDVPNKPQIKVIEDNTHIFQ